MASANGTRTPPDVSMDEKTSPNPADKKRKRDEDARASATLDSRASRSVNAQKDILDILTPCVTTYPNVSCAP